MPNKKGILSFCKAKGLEQKGMGKHSHFCLLLTKIMWPLFLSGTIFLVTILVFYARCIFYVVSFVLKGRLLFFSKEKRSMRSFYLLLRIGHVRWFLKRKHLRDTSLCIPSKGYVLFSFLFLRATRKEYEHTSLKSLIRDTYPMLS